jgi:hypothetical protein
MACFIGQQVQNPARRASPTHSEVSAFFFRLCQRFKGGWGIFTDVQYFGPLPKAGAFQAIDEASWLKAEISTLGFAGLHQAFRIGSGIT